MRDLIGRTLDHYRIVEKIGEGGMGEVYRAHDERLDRDVAVKVLPASVAQDPERVARFEREARAVARLDHPNILAIHDFGTDEGVTYSVTELLDGRNLRQAVPGSGMPWQKVVEIGAAIADGLAAAHGKGVVHRDLKPENVFITSEGWVKVLDFGLAQIKEPIDVEAETATLTPAGTAAGTVLGTMGYMAPEQLRGEPADARSDIFALGCLLYEILSGRAAFLRNSTAETTAAMLKEDPPDLSDSVKSFPVELESAIRRCLEKSPDERFQSARDLAYSLRSIASRTAPYLVRSAPRFGSERRGAWWVAGGVAAVSVLLILHFAGLRDRVSGAKGAGTIESLAVLPFVNAGGDPDTEYLSDGITENLINKLSQLPELKVMSSSSVFRYKGQERDAQKAGRELGVRAVLSGRLLQRGDGLSISVELLDTRDNTNIWGERYNRRLEDMIALEEEISRTITDKLRIRLTSEDERRLTRRSTESGAAYRLYLRGRYHSNKLTVEDIDKAIGYFEQAIEVDPGYAAAFSGLADAYTFLGTDLGFLPHRDAFPKARDAAFAALEIDGACAEAHAALAFARFLDWDWVGAETAFKRALELNPDSVIARDQYSCYLAHMGRLDEAIEEVKCAIESDPLALLPNSDLSYYYVLARRFEEALRQIEMIMNLESNFVLPYWNLGLLYNAQSRYEEAIAQLTKAKALSGNNPVIDADLARAYAGADRQDEALGLLRELEKMSRRRYVSQGIVALVHIGLGQKEEAFDRLEAAYADQDFFLAKLKVDPRFDPLRSDPRFADLLRRMDFPD